MSPPIIDLLAKDLLDYALPLQCVTCDAEGSGICAECLALAVPLREPYCDICADRMRRGVCDNCRREPLAVEGVRSAYVLDGPIRDAIHAFKYRNYRALAPQLGSLLANRLTEGDVPCTIIAPVPMHKRRLRQRGYNQAALLAHELGKLSGIPVREDLVNRPVYSKPQVQIGSRDGRAQAVRGSFAAIGDASGEAVVLVDDVITTGSTVSACAAAITSAGAASVWALSLARE